MTSVRDKKVLRKRMNSIKNRERTLKRTERKRYRRVRRLRLRQRLRLDLYNWRMKQKQHQAERRKKMIAKRETAKLNRTLKRRRKK